jgi:hypothetical protein
VLGLYRQQIFVAYKIYTTNKDPTFIDHVEVSQRRIKCIDTNLLQIIEHKKRPWGTYANGSPGLGQAQQMW